MLNVGTNIIERIYYVYVYCNPLKSGIYQYDNIMFDCEPFYVGCGKNKRCNDHLHEARRDVSKIGNKHKYYTIIFSSID